MSQLLQVEIPNFGSTVLGSLNEQRLLGQHCDVSIVVNGQSFQAHRSVLAASSLYFRDLFSGSSKEQFELPSSVAPACFAQILSFCYTGRLTMAASEQLVVMYTAGYLQVQHIVERGMELMFKANSPHCDSQSTAQDDPGSEPHSPPPAPTLGPPGWSLSAPLATAGIRRIKQEAAEAPVTAQGTGVRRGEGAMGARPQRSGSLFYTGVGGLQPYPLTPGEGSSPGASSLPPTDSPTSYQNEDEEFEEESYDSLAEDAYGQLYSRSASTYAIQDKLEVSGMPLSLESRSCVLLRRDLVSLPASLISQIGYRCHPKLYTEGDPGEKLELVGGTGVFMTRGQLMNCHLCAGIKHKVLLRRLLATFFDRNTLANSCGTGIRSSTCDPSRKPLDSRVLNAVKLYCQNFAPNFKESEMNVIAADMCTNARRVRKRWLPKIKSMLPDGMEVCRGGASTNVAHVIASQAGLALPFEADFKALVPSGLNFEQQLYRDRKETHRTHLQLSRVSPGVGPAMEGVEPELNAAQVEEEREGEDEAPLEGAEGSAGVNLPSPKEEVGDRVGGRGCQPSSPEGQQGEQTGEGLRVNVQ
ncbi:nucleus accumbens-associated protein 2 [Anguilla anguilla]|uniref:nucleus accumbens-associated protein 2 n=1 Tax=Anguilla anguilla TaxID=7936 RepID=UPI0015A97D62|nr:nucleus accumbens-associated protein 2 [Anguilla anguilla]XP_035236214.1 nucleus accumbens-associated protein 2 [Anguilla anguilla]